ncbi:response regulator [bacterium]|nr:response regulator [bacterium]
MFSTVLIIDKRPELSVKYKKSVVNSETSAIIAHNLNDGLKFIQSEEPDMIIVSDTIEEQLPNFCRRIRSLTYNTRPVIIALSKSADSDDRIKTLESGADDFISEPVNIEEFKTRIQAHLRRDIESNLDNKTLLPNKKITEKCLKRVLNSDLKHAVLLITLQNMESYKAVYTEVASDKLIQTFSAITKSSLEEEDFFGQLDENNFIIITNIYRAEKLAAFLTFAFDTVVPKFYSETDSKRGYIILSGDRLAGMRANFVSILIGGLVDNFQMTESVNALLERLYNVRNIAKVHSGSNYAIDRLRLSGENSVADTSNANKIYIKENDTALSLLLRTTLELQGYDIANELNPEDSVQPGIIIMDSNDDLSALEICTELKNNAKFVNTKIIVTSTVHDKTAILNSGADLYLPKPYEIHELISWIEYLKKY